MPTAREYRIAENTSSVIDFASRLIGAIETGNWHYANDKLGQLERALVQLGDEIRRTDQPASGETITTLVASYTKDFRIGKALYGKPEPQTPSDPEIAPEVAAHVLHHFGCEGGSPASGFKTTLMLTIAQADASNRQHLARAFPAYVAAVNLAQWTAHGTAALQKLATRRGA